MSKCDHSDYDDYFERCTECGAEREQLIDERFEEIRESLRAERMSYSELDDLVGYWEDIDKNDVELLEAAGVCEHCRAGLHSADDCKGEPYGQG